MKHQMDEKIVKEALAPYVEGLSEALPSQEESAEITFSADFEKRMERMMRKQRRFYYPWVNTSGKRVAAVLVIAVLGLTVTTFGVKAVREPVLKFMVKTHERYSEITLEDAATDCVEFVKTLPTYIPEGFSPRRGKKEGSSFYRKEYHNEDGRRITYIQKSNSGLNMTLNTENSECYKEFTIQSYPAILNVNLGETMVLLTTEHYLYCVSGKVSAEELVRMMESIPLEH